MKMLLNYSPLQKIKPLLFSSLQLNLMKLAVDGQKTMINSDFMSKEILELEKVRSSLDFYGMPSNAAAVKKLQLSLLLGDLVMKFQMQIS